MARREGGGEGHPSSTCWRQAVGRKETCSSFRSLASEPNRTSLLACGRSSGRQAMIRTSPSPNVDSQAIGTLPPSPQIVQLGVDPVDPVDQEGQRLLWRLAPQAARLPSQAQDRMGSQRTHLTTYKSALARPANHPQTIDPSTR
ncbi:uncharacterized protein UV8b_00547 [Ustilaginoidea virens]|uniref:Uncharacterized protein n=1 Tax=Ustilaginoidea virens TaxID=1159556 RepID=A0A8E5MDJ8_USTVR|nr:uncharacterized protein UV8b_00547 [Ustilaginoidea virens]QUC16306.1 hypothetical protein UV8b_00547 [Ustilaginoidea virens]